MDKQSRASDIAAQIKEKIPDEYEKLMSDIAGADNAEKLLLIFGSGD